MEGIRLYHRTTETAKHLVFCYICCVGYVAGIYLTGQGILLVYSLPDVAEALAEALATELFFSAVLVKKKKGRAG